MKKLKILVILTVLLSILYACSKDFLERTPQAVVSDGVFEDDESTIDLAINRLYGTLRWGFWRWGWIYFFTHEAPSQDIVAAGEQSYGEATRFTYDQSHWFLELAWPRYYEYIHYCNVIIDRTPFFENREIARRAEAQAKFFRAYYNFDITNVFGEAVLRDRDPVDSTEYNIPKSSREEFYELIISDLEYAVRYLPTRSEWGMAELGRVTKGAAMGLLSKVYLYDQDYAKAKAYADSVIMSGEYALYPDYRELFNPDQRYCEEILLPGHYQYDNAIWVGRNWNAYAQHQGCEGEFGSAGFYPSDELGEAYEEGDPRKTATLFTSEDTIIGYVSNNPLIPNYESGGVNIPDGVQYLNKKVIWPTSYWNGNEFSWTDVNPMLLRYADILLIYAEACNELGETNEALNKLEMVRYRARGNKTFAESVADGDNGGDGALSEITETDKAALRELIWHERHVEMALEGQRWFDLVRYEQVVPGYTTNYLVVSMGRTEFDYGKHRRFPLPDMFITSSLGVLEQHDEWR